MSNDTERSLKLFIVLSRVSKVLIEETRDLHEQHGLNPTEFAVLELLYHKGKQPIQKIGRKILLTSGSMTYVVDKLERKNLLERVTSEKDKRISHVSLTKLGCELISTIFPEHAQNIEKLLSTLTVEEQEQAIHLVKKLGLSIKDLS